MEESGEKCLILNGDKVFVGEYQVSFLGGGRVALPKKIRALLSGGKVVLTRGFENCIFGYEKKAWENSSLQQLATPVTDAKSRSLRRYLFSGAMVIKFDAQGRVVLPAFLADYAKLKKEITLIGAGDHFEIWDAACWRHELNSLESQSI